jgi:hypothetical protein
MANTLFALRQSKRRNLMGKELDDFVNGLQNQILEETRAEFGDVAFERWQNPLYAGAMDNPDGHGCVTGSCDDTMQIFLKFEKDKVKMETSNPKRLRALEKEVIQPVYLFFPVGPYPVNRREFHLLRTRIYSR